jgi:hypothetical protein
LQVQCELPPEWDVFLSTLAIKSPRR